MKVAVLGFGTVGVGVYEMLHTAAGLEPGPVLVRPGKDNEPFKVSSLDAILNDPTVDAVAEVMGGIEPAFTYVSAALKAGKHAVTSNKALVALHGPELQLLAAEHGVSFLFSAACGGAVPILHNLALAVSSDSIRSLGGILNGTTNFMLDCMQRRGMDYDDVLKEAQQLGYAEADPTADVSGLDALRKIMLACAVSYDMLPVDGLLCEGIESITSADVQDFQSRNLTCRLLASGGKNPDGSIYAYVEPVLFGPSAPECSVLMNFNMAKYDGQNSGKIVLIGQGAGRYPTASAVLRDLTDIKNGRSSMMRTSCQRCSANNADASHPYYIRVPAEFANRFPSQTVLEEDGICRMISEPISVQFMHKTAAELRSKDVSIFFAAIDEE